ncbi:DUF6624 domain-containing protein [Streptomyces sp. NPDC048604]|uniref:DUF6624 domain-containing protein n=1 Tax=Streptomyces sp. NPDC048604 TaxID=3365578 RepID=UPI0037121479
MPPCRSSRSEITTYREPEDTVASCDVPDLAADLRRRAEADRRARNELLRTGRPGDLFEVDAENTMWLKAIVAEHGWPGVALVGEQGADDAWLLVQHADRDPEFQLEALELLQIAVDAHDAPARHLACLTDRVLVAFDQPQLYGTQYTGEGAGMHLLPVHDPERLDERRASAGLETAASYDRRMRAKYQGSSLRTEGRDGADRHMTSR